MESIVPFWDDYHLTLNYTTEQFRDPTQLEFWVKSGHDSNKLTIDLCQFNTDNDITTRIKSYFSNLDHIGICFHRLRPGHYLPLHKDKYGFYSKKYNISDLDLIKRYIIFLEDCSPGQMLIVKDTVYSNWKAGDIAHWQGTDIHSAVNLGMTDRYTLQVTGIINDR